MDQFVTEFCEVTGSTPEIARNYHTVQHNICSLTLGTFICVTLSFLQVSDGNVERAITLFLETGGAELIFHEQQSISAITSTSNQQQSHSPPPPIPAQSGVMIDHFGYEENDDEDHGNQDFTSEREDRFRNSIHNNTL